MARCGFCGNEIPKGTGFIFVEKTGKALYFCSSKCERNVGLGRIPRKTRWTQEFRKLKGKLSAAAEKEALQQEAEATASGGKPKVSMGGAAAKKLKGGA
ncbi:50S ribosomal protein L24e [Candidatus Woesearchaeota archaeon]|nr:50S ribosomal protein L24e [Candidatus Woesearchaeota archaeon]